MEVSLYIHIPFCIAKCNYCDFFSVPISGNKIGLYVAALATEMENFSAKWENIQIATIYIGGGTPSLLPPRELEFLLKKIDSLFEIVAGAEITLECNPGTIDTSYLSTAKELGINRLSIGIQSLDDRELTLLGRIHNSAEAGEALRTAITAGYENISADIIFAIPGQTVTTLERTIDIIVGEGATHISAYLLTPEPNTPYFNSIKQGELIALSDEKQEELYYSVRKLLSDYSFTQYEISSYAKDGKVCKHNLRYWRRMPYLGFGAAAHSFMNETRWANVADVNFYINAMETGTTALDFSEQLTETQIGEEKIMLGLRLVAGGALPERILTKLRPLIDRGFLHRNGDTIFIPSEHLFISDEIIIQASHLISR